MPMDSVRAISLVLLKTCAHNSGTCSRQMTSATTVGDAYEISCPTLSWEQVGGYVNEGPGKYAPLLLC